MFKALHEEGRMLLYGSLTGEPILVGEDPRYILAGRRVLEVFWGRYWVAGLDSDARHKLTDAIAVLMRDGILETKPGRRYTLDDIGAAVTQAESVGKEGKVLLTPG